MDTKSPLRKRIMVYTIASGCVLIGYLAVGEAVYYWKESVHHYESGAVSDLWALQTMQNNYKTDHGSYAATFGQLGVPFGAKLNGDFLTWDGGYRYQIVGTLPDVAGSIRDYHIDARPITYSYHSRRSFLMDQTGVIHFTSANRGATADDPSIRPQQ